MKSLGARRPCLIEGGGKRCRLDMPDEKNPSGYRTCLGTKAIAIESCSSSFSRSRC